MGADVDQEENLRPGLGMFLFGEDDPAVVGGGTGMEASQWAAQVVGFQARIGQVRGHPPQGLFNLGLERVQVSVLTIDTGFRRFSV
jgi:hypothetical protein